MAGDVADQQFVLTEAGEVTLSIHLQAQKAELQFSYLVPDKGMVAGVLYYFPFENERENVPMEPIQNQLVDPAGPMVLTQHPSGTQLGVTQARNSPEPDSEPYAFAASLIPVLLG